MDTWSLAYVRRSAVLALADNIRAWLDYRLAVDRALTDPRMRLYDHLDEIPQPEYIGAGVYNDLAADGRTPAIFVTTRCDTWTNHDATTILDADPVLTVFVLLGEADTQSAEADEWKSVALAYIEGCMRILTTRWDGCRSVGVMNVEPATMTDAVETRTPNGRVWTRVVTCSLRLHVRQPNLWPISDDEHTCLVLGDGDGAGLAVADGVGLAIDDTCAPPLDGVALGLGDNGALGTGDGAALGVL